MHQPQALLTMPRAQVKQPYLAFVATQNIPARTEFTINYDPKSEQDSQESSNGEMPRGARECMCGAAKCRGWVKV